MKTQNKMYAKDRIFEKELHLGRLEDAENFPKVILIDTVSYCNLECSMCVHKEMTRKKGAMTWEVFRKIIDEIAEVDKNVRVWMVFFGEALILKNRKPSIFDMIAYAKSKGLMDIVLNSNGNLLDEEVSKKLIESGLDAIYFGIDAATPESYSKIRVGGDYYKTVNNIKSLVQLKKVDMMKKPEIYVQFVEMELNKYEKEDFINFWKDESVIVKIRPKVSWAGSIDAPNLIFDNKDRWPCHWAMQTMSITDTGKVVTCAVDLDAKFIAGDVSVQSLKEVWNGKLKELRELHKNRKFEELPELCANCKDWQAARADYY